MIDDTSTVTPEPTPPEDEAKQTKNGRSGTPQERTKNPEDTKPKWPGGHEKGENEQ